MKTFFLKIFTVSLILFVNNVLHAQLITTFAGNHIPGFSGDGGLATSASLGIPAALAVDKAGNIYIADAGENVIREVSVSGIITMIAGNDTAYGYTGDSGPATAATFNDPDGIALDSSGNIYIADNDDYVVRKINLAGIITTVAGNGIYGASGDGGMATGASLRGAVGVAVDARGNLYISDGKSTVRIVDTSGVIHSFAGVLTPGYTGDYGAATAAELDGPAGLAVDQKGNLFIADNQNNVIRKVDTSGIITTIAGNGDYYGLGYGGYGGDSGLATSAELNLPSGVFADKYGSLFIADLGNAIIRKVTTSGIITTIAGTSAVAGYGGDSGLATSAYLNAPSNIIVDSNSNLYIADEDNNVVRKVDAVSISSNNGDTVCNGDTVSFQATTFLMDSGIVYQWKKNGINISAGTPVYVTDSIQNGDIITCTLINAVTGNTIATADSIKMIWRSLPSFVSITVSTGDTICSGSLVSFTASGDTDISYKWIKNGSIVDSGMTYSCTPDNGDRIICAVAGEGVCGASAPFVMTVHSYEYPEVYISSPAGLSFCPFTAVTFTSASFYSGVSPDYKWEVNDSVVITGGSPDFVYTPAEGDMISCIMTSDYNCLLADTVVSNLLSISVLPLVTPAITIVSNADTVCSGTAVTLSASVTNGGITPVFQWFKNGSGISTDTPFTYVPANGDIIKCLLTSNACAIPDTVSSNTIVLSVSPELTPGITIVTSTDSVCSGTPVTYTLIDSNGGAAPAFLWKVNGANVAIGSSYSYSPSNGDVIKCLMTSDAICLSTATAVSGDIVMSVDSVFLTPSLTIESTVGDTVCAGTVVTYTVISVNQGPTPLYQWKVNGINRATGAAYAYVPANGDIISCVLTSSARCLAVDTAASDSVTMTVTPALTPFVSIVSSGGYTVCAGAAVTYTATAVNGGAAPFYQWKVNGVNEGAGDTLTYVPLDADVITCVLTSSYSCLTADTVTASGIRMSVDSVLVPAISITADPGDTVCAGTMVNFVADIFAGGTLPVYQWKKNGVDVTAGATYLYPPADGDVITCVLTSNAACTIPDTAVSGAINMVVKPVITPSVNITADPGADVCAGTSVAYSAIVVGGGAAPVLTWRNDGIDIASGSSCTYAPADGAVISCLLISNAVCAIPDTVISPAITMTVNAALTPSVTITAIPGTVVTAPGQSVTFVSSVTGAGTSLAYQWYVNGAAMPGATATTFTTDTFFANDTVTCVVTIYAPCVADTIAVSNSLDISVSLGVAPFAMAGNIVLFPNPNKGSFTIKGNPGSSAEAMAALEVTDILGQVVYRNRLPVQQGEIDSQILLDSNLANGIYLLKVTDGYTVNVLHFVIDK